MRHVLGFWLFCSMGAFAQQQEKRLVERLLDKPDMSLLNSMDGKKFEGGDGVSFERKSSQPRPFQFDQRYLVQSYHGSRSFLGIKNPWVGRRVYDPKQANVMSNSVVPNAGRKVEVRSAHTPKFYDSTRTAFRAEDPVKTSPYLVPGGAQGSFDQINARISKELTVEQVREILNKQR